MPNEFLLYCSLPGAAGGLTWFLIGIRRGSIRNNRYVRKAVLEITGAVLVAAFVAYPLAPLFTIKTPVLVLSFATGAAWASIVQLLRRWITNHFDTFLSGRKD